MNKLRNFIILGSVLLVVSMSNMSKYCQHQFSKWGFKTSSLEASVSLPDPTTGSDDYEPENMDNAISEENTISNVALTLELIDMELVAADFASSDSSSTPKPLVWPALSNVRFQKKYNPEYDQYFDYPVFGKRLKEIDGTKVRIKGYMIPLDVGLYALSKNPYAACFFCGGAGPETIIGLTFAKPPELYKTDEYLTLEGTFRLNDQNVEMFMYQLYEVKVVK